MSGQVLVAGVGNLFFGDDGFGPEVVRHMAEPDQLTGPDQPPLGEEVRLVDYGIRGVHLCYDLLDGYAALVLVDALPAAGRPPGEVTVLAVGPGDVGSLSAGAGAGYDPHGMNPVAVLAGLPALGGTLPPTYVVGAAPAVLDEVIGLSAPMRAAVPGAAAAVRELLRTRPWADPSDADRHAAASCSSIGGKG